MSTYIQIVDEDKGDGNPIELALEPDNETLGISSLQNQFPEANGLAYRNPQTNNLRSLRVADEKIYLPVNEDDCYSYSYIVQYPKSGTKRTASVSGGGPPSKSFKMDKIVDLIALGLPYSMTEEEVKEYFTQFGEMDLCQLKTFPDSGKSKGFAFIRFVDTDVQQLVLDKEDHHYDGKDIQVQIPRAKMNSLPPQYRKYCGISPAELKAMRKIFVGKLSKDIDEDDLKEYFSQYGTVTDCFVPNPFRSFGFVTFEDSDTALNMLGDDHVIKGTNVHIESAQPKKSDDDRRGGRGGVNSYGGYGSGYGAGGGGYGGFGGGGFGDYGGFGGGGYDAMSQLRGMDPDRLLMAAQMLGGSGRFGGGGGGGRSGGGRSGGGGGGRRR